MMKNFYNFSARRLMRRFAVSMTAAVLIAGCASTPAPTEQMAISAKGCG